MKALFKRLFDLQRFATTVSSDIPQDFKTFYDNKLIEFAKPALVHEQFAQESPIPKGEGKTIKWRTYRKLAKATTALTEGVTPSGSKLSMADVTANIAQYGDFVTISDVIEMAAIDNNVARASEVCGQQMGETLDTICREVMNGGTAKILAPSVSGGSVTPVTLRTNITKNCKLTADVVRQAARLLKANDAKKIDGDYVAIIHPDVAYDLMKDSEWKSANEYAGSKNIFNGEIGKLAGVRFIETTEAKKWAPPEITQGYTRLTVKANASSSATSITVNEVLDAESSKSYAVYIDGVANTVTAIANNTTYSTLTISALSANVSAGAVICGKATSAANEGGKDGSTVYSTLVLGKDAYGKAEIAGGNAGIIVKQLGHGDDPLNQRATIGWKANAAYAILDDTRIVRIESASSFSGETEAN
ncbi:MAG: N4-gp56 family major capsid protein [Clostridia bacterium]|nr:N4-gp56 family major capsid protein [Clostridia bacterium]